MRGYKVGVLAIAVIGLVWLVSQLIAWVQFFTHGVHY